MELLSCEKLTVSYGDRPVIDSLDLSVNEGDYLCIIGENGSGKTTLVKTLLGLIRPDSGKISFAEGISHRDIGYLSQQKDIRQDFPATVEEVVLSGHLGSLGKRFFYNAEERENSLSNMEKMGVKELSKRRFRELSGGQQQRVLLARALCAGKKILLLDEPGTALDETGKKELISLLKDLHKQGMTIIVITHDIEDMIEDATRILSFNRNIRQYDAEAFRKERWS